MLEAMFEHSPNLLGNSLAEPDGVATGATPRAVRGRITASSFRALTARLKRQTYVADEGSSDAVVWPDIPDLFEPPVSAAATAPEAAAATQPITTPPSEIVLDEPPVAWTEDGSALDIVIPSFEPLASGEAPAELPDVQPVPQPAGPVETEAEADTAAPEPAVAFEAIGSAAEPQFEAQDFALPEGAASADSVVIAEPLDADAFEDAPVSIDALAEAGQAEELGGSEIAALPEEPQFEAQDFALPEGAASADNVGIAEPLDADALEDAPVSVHALAEAGQAEELSESEIAVLPEESLPQQPEASFDEAVPESAQLSEPLPAAATTDELVAEAPADVADGIVTPAVESAAPETITEQAETPATVGDEQVLGEDDAMVLKMLTKAIYSRPSLAERAAFLRDVANTFESEARLPPEEAQPAVRQLLERGAAPVEPAVEPPTAPMMDSLASRLGPGRTLLRKPEDRDDPFNRPSAEIARPPAERPPGDEESGAHALSLIEMMTSGSGTAQPQERALAADTLLHLIPRVPAKQLLTIVERLTIMETPPPLVVAKLIRDPRAEIVGPLVERCTAITDQDLIVAVSEGDVAKRRIIARRRHVSAALSDALIATGDPSVLLTLIRNPNAVFSHDAFYVLADKAAKNQNLLPPLTTRNDLLAPVAFELFWHLPSELRRYVLSRFLTDSETLSKILKITRAADDSAEAKFPSRETMERMTDTAIRGHVDSAAKMMAEAAAIDVETALRILSDREGEPLAVALKAMGQQRSKLGDILASLRSPDSGVLRPDRNVVELESIFDTLSFNKARILLTYWDWFVLKKGPYAPHH